MSKKKVMFISSTGGHLTELLQLKDMFQNYDFCLVTEKTKSNMYLKEKYGKNVHFLIYGTKYHILSYPFKLLANCFISLFYYIRFQPGVQTAGPMCCIGKLLGSKIIYIETFANMITKTSTGRLLYPISDKFIVQWESMKKIYPKADFGGWIF